MRVIIVEQGGIIPGGLSSARTAWLARSGLSAGQRTSFRIEIPIDKYLHLQSLRDQILSLPSRLRVGSIAQEQAQADVRFIDNELPYPMPVTRPPIITPNGEVVATDGSIWIESAKNWVHVDSSGKRIPGPGQMISYLSGPSGREPSYYDGRVMVKGFPPGYDGPRYDPTKPKPVVDESFTISVPTTEQQTVTRFIMRTNYPGVGVKYDTGANYRGCSRDNEGACDPRQFDSEADAFLYAQEHNETPIRVTSVEQAWQMVEGKKPIITQAFSIERAGISSIIMIGVLWLLSKSKLLTS